jgi:hypothetical protein
VWLAERNAPEIQFRARPSNRKVVSVRHVFGLVLAVVLAAALFAGAGWGTWRIEALRVAGTSLTGISGLLALGALVATGLLLGILLVVPRVSPLATALPGLVLLAWSAATMVSASRAERLIPLPGSHLAAGWQTLLTGGVLALLGVVMLVPLFVPSRWRRREARDDFSRPTATSLLQ